MRCDSSARAARADRGPAGCAARPAGRACGRSYSPPTLALRPPISVHAHVVIGRSSGCHLVLGDDTVSRRHAELRLEGGRWLLRDLGSANGTLVNGRRVVEAEVRPGDVVHLGGARLRLYYAHGEAAAAISAAIGRAGREARAEELIRLGLKELAQ